MRIKYWLIGLVGVFALASFEASLSRSVYAQEAAPSSANIAELLAKAEAGDAESQVNLGKMYYLGRGVPEDEAQAVSWYRKAAQQGDAKAQFELGEMYDFGYGVPEDDAQAVSWYGKAAQQGLAEAQYTLGLMYAKGEGVPEDYTQAVSWYCKAAQQGHVDSQFLLGAMYAEGEGVLQNLVTAYIWANFAAAQGNEAAIDLKSRIPPEMTSAQISQAQRLSDECLAKTYQECGL